MNRPSTAPRTQGACLLSLALAAAVQPAAAHAAAHTDADASDGQPTIIVTGKIAADANPNANANAPYKVEKSESSRFTEPVRDTPRTITIIPKEVLKDIGATSLRDVVRSTPGVTLGTGEGGNAFGDRIFIRGFEARNDVYIDGMRDPGVTSRETFAVEQIEVVKGAAGAFGGRGTTGGLVSLQSKQAGSRNFIATEAAVGTDNFRRFTVDANRRLTDTLSVRINALWHDADTPGRDHVWQRRSGIAGAVHWAPGERITLDADYYHYRFNGMSDYGLPYNTATNQPYAVNPDNFYGRVGRDFLAGGADIATLNAHYKLSEAIDFHQQIRQGQVTNRYVVSVPGQGAVATTQTPSGFGVNASPSQRNATTDYTGDITELTAKFHTWGVDHTAVTGFEYAHERVRNLRYAFPAYVEDASGNPTSTGTLPPLDLYNPQNVLGYTIPAVVDPTVPASVNTVETFSAYAIDTLKFGPHWEVTGGLRYDHYDINATGPISTTNPALYAREQAYGFLNWQASLTWKPVTAATFYGSVSTSSNPSGEQLDSTSDSYGGLGTGTVDLTPERNHAYELGGKYEIAHGRLLLTAALYRIDKDNAREQQSANVWVNVGKLRSQGFELGINGNITPRLAVFGGYAYIDAKIIQSAVVTPGTRFANIPAHTASLLATYALTPKFTLGGQATYRARIYGGSLGANTGTSVPDYWRFDAVARYRFSDEVELRVNGMNLTDKRYFDAIYRSTKPFAYMAPGRSVMATMAVKF